MDQTWTVLSLLNWCRDFFARKGIETPRLDAEVLLASVLGTERLGLYLRFDQPLDAAELAAMHELVRRRGNREPVAHLVGTREFHGLSFQSDARALVPRPETELLVDVTLAALPPEACSVCEIGVGAGCVAVTLAVERPAWRVTGTDISADALELAVANIAHHGITDRVALAAGSLFAGRTEIFDAVISNPPYVATADCDGAMPEVAQFEPRVALDGGVDGLDVIRELVAAAPERLRSGGLLALECGRGQAPSIAALLRDSGAFDMIEMHRDLAEIQRVVTARRV